MSVSNRACSTPSHSRSAATQCMRRARLSNRDPSAQARVNTRVTAQADNVPKVKSSGRMTYRPESFQEIVIDASASALSGIKNGVKRMEVEFPPTPISIEGYKGASDTFIDANVQLALSAARLLAGAGRKVHVVMPDQGEYDRGYKIFKTTLEMMPGVSLGHLKEQLGQSMIANLSTIFSGGPAPSSTAAAAVADTFIIINATCVELPRVETYVNEFVKDNVAILWNLELDTLRGDLGLLAFPPKDLHYRFLSFFKPVFFLRTRDYSKSVPVSPYIVNYSGALLREYPGPWQVMLKIDGGNYACVAEDEFRYNLGDVKEQLLAAMRLNTEEEGSAMQFLRRGYKTATWFEEDTVNEKSTAWRS